MTSIQPRLADRYARIIGVGSYRPSRVVTNEDICTVLDSTPEWIEQRTGIVERRWAMPDETLEMMSLAAARRAIEMAGIKPTQVSTVILSSVSHHFPTPGLAPKLAYHLGAEGASAWDISAACAGFCHALGMADALVRSRQSEYVLVIGAERLSDQTDPTDRGIAFLLADGAGAVVVGPSQEPGIGPVVWGSQGSSWDVIQSDMDWFTARDIGATPCIRMEGNKVFKWAITSVAEYAAQAITAAGLKPEDLDVFIPHQANNRIIDSMLKHLKLPETVKVARDIRFMGNTSSASIPLTMAAMLERGDANRGDKALMIGFGAGLVYAGQVALLP